MKGEKEVRKSKIIKIIEISFILFKKKKLVIFVLIGFIANNINRSIVYISLKINNQIKKNYKSKSIYNSYIFLFLLLMR